LQRAVDRLEVELRRIEAAADPFQQVFVVRVLGVAMAARKLAYTRCRRARVMSTVTAAVTGLR
jgi:hypothetical protein